MEINPLAPPADCQVLQKFLDHFGLRDDANPRVLLREVATAFAQLPYENLSKIVRLAERENIMQSLRDPAEVVGDHVTLGTGGTCFSLTATLLHLLRALGWRAEPILADRRYGANTHCALVVWIDDHPHLLDPGYLIVDPIPLETTREQRIITSFNELTLTPQPGGDKIDLITHSQGQSTYRLTFKSQPVDAGEFLHVWKESFDWDMMHYPVLTRVNGDQQLYLQGNRFQVRDHQSVQRCELPPDELVRRITQTFGIDPAIAARALSLLNNDSTSTRVST